MQEATERDEGVVAVGEVCSRDAHGAPGSQDIETGAKNGQINELWRPRKCAGWGRVIATRTSKQYCSGMDRQ